MSIFAKDGPGAMEKMVAGMLGFTPEQMAETLTGFRKMIVDTHNDMQEIRDNLKRLMEAQNVEWRSTRDGGGNSGDAGGAIVDSRVTGDDRDAA